MVSTSASYTARRAHAQSREASRHSAMARFRVTFGTGGIVCFGSRTAVVANLGSIDLHCRPMEDATPPARIEAALGVGAHGGPLEYDSLVRYQEAAAAFSEVVQPPLAEIHTWKLIATLLGHKPVDTQVSANFGSPCKACSWEEDTSSHICTCLPCRRQ